MWGVDEINETYISGYQVVTAVARDHVCIPAPSFNPIVVVSLSDGGGGCKHSDGASQDHRRARQLTEMHGVGIVKGDVRKEEEEELERCGPAT